MTFEGKLNKILYWKIEGQRRKKPRKRWMDGMKGSMIGRGFHGQGPIEAEDHCRLNVNHCLVKHSLVK